MPSPDDDTKYWVALTRIPGMGTVRFSVLERVFPSMAEAWKAPAAQLRAVLDARTAGSLTARRNGIDPDEEMARLERLGARALRWSDPGYPARLKEIPDPPPVLYLRGPLLSEDERSVAIVGTRKVSAYGREAAKQLTQDLVHHGVTVVSGLARGVDAQAHRAALDARGRTVGIMGSGLDVVYPSEHRDLARRVVDEGGALVSEHPLGTRPDGRNFPRRNRIISGMTLGTLVVEADEKSGALWTVQHALEQGREVFAVPGNIFSPASRGTNRLLQEGAKLVMGYQDVLEELNLTATVEARQLELAPPPAPEDGPETMILTHLAYEPLHIDEVRRATGLPMNIISGTLTVMEIKGLVRQTGSMHYVRA